MSRRLTRTYAIANLEDLDPVAAASPSDIETDDEDALDTRKGPKRRRSAAGGELIKTVAPPVGARKPTIVNGKVIPPRSPLPARAKRPVNPGAPDMAKTKRTSAEVSAAAERKATLQHQADKLERRRIEMLAKMELEEELEEEEEERTVVRKRASMESLYSVDDVTTRSDDGEGTGMSIAEGMSECGDTEEDDHAVTVKNRVASKPSQVCFFLQRCRDHKY
jgi:hypothetical protein